MTRKTFIIIAGLLILVFSAQYTMQAPPPSNSQHSIDLFDFNVGYEVVLQIKSPCSGRYHLDLIDNVNNTFVHVLHVDARYNWIGDVNTLVLNTFQGDIWNEEVRPSGFDFTHDISVTLQVKAEEDGFRILQNANEIAFFTHRLPVTSVTRIRVLSSGNKAAQDAALTVKFV